jgi:hypothetical protein
MLTRYAQKDESAARYFRRVGLLTLTSASHLWMRATVRCEREKGTSSGMRVRRWTRHRAAVSAPSPKTEYGEWTWSISGSSMSHPYTVVTAGAGINHVFNYPNGDLWPQGFSSLVFSRTSSARSASSPDRRSCRKERASELGLARPCRSSAYLV